MNSVLLMMAQEGGQGGASFWIMIGLMFIVFYFFMIRPQQKKAKEAKSFREELKKGDTVITIGGVHGKVVSMKDSTMVIEVEDGSKLKIERSCISPELSAGTGSSELQQKK